MADRVFGQIPDNPEGSTYVNREVLSQAGVHRPLQGGICGGGDGAESIVVSGGYVDDQDYGDLIVYTGQGGRDPNSGRQVEDQELVRGNLGLARSCLDGLPVRVIRGQQGNPTYSPTSGYRYDGLFRVDEYWHDQGEDGHRIWRFRLVALEGQPAASPTAEDESETATPGRAVTTIQRIVRSNKVAEAVKNLNEYTCQVCSSSLVTPAGPYAEAAHIRALGTPHNGPDILDNLLCLCPNDHVRFDAGAIYIDLVNEDFEVFDFNGTAMGPLRLKPGHAPNPNYLRYHRQHFAAR